MAVKEVDDGRGEIVNKPCVIFLYVTKIFEKESMDTSLEDIGLTYLPYHLLDGHTGGNYLANEENLKRVQTIFSKGNFQLLPKRVLNGECQLPRSYINLDHQSPFPDNAIVQFVGNSHLNQLVTSLLCRYDRGSSPSPICKRSHIQKSV
jgi:hypothetical protein